MVAPIFFLRSRISVEMSSRTAGMIGSLFLPWRRANPLGHQVVLLHHTHGTPGNDAKPQAPRVGIRSPGRVSLGEDHFPWNDMPMSEPTRTRPPHPDHPT